jgi:predicted GH43/DUF377 family glycosyl hydrolase
MRPTSNRTVAETPNRELFVRHEANPILTAQDWPIMVNAVFNPGATVFEGETLLLVRVEDRSGISRLTVARSADGVSGWEVETERSMSPDVGSWTEHWGIEDPRITEIEGRYYVAYTGFSTSGPLVCLAVTDDFVSFERLGVVQVPENKDAALFPRRINGRYAMIHRPVALSSHVGANIWISFSEDLRNWGDSSPLIEARRGGWWDANKVGLGPPPLETEAGWLIVYHGVRSTAAGALYRVGLALLDKEHPERVIARGNEWVFGPQAPYEVAGDVPDVVFPCGWIVGDDGDTIRLYYGAADTCVALATGNLSELLTHLFRHPMG